MRLLLDILLRIGRTEEERQALRGDLDETYSTEIRPSRSWLAAEAWYAREVLMAFAVALRYHARIPRLRTGLTGDLRYAVRRWRRRPGFAVMATLTLALGIAAATATFSVVDGVLLRPLPWKEVDRLVYVHGVYPERRNNPATAPTWDRGTLSYRAWDALRTTPMFETVAVWHGLSRLDMTFGENRDDLVRTASVSSNFLPTLGVRVILGRYFTEREDNVSTDSIILTWETWQRRFGGRTDVIGERVPLGSASSGGRYPKTIVGVLEGGFRFEGEPPEILLPVGIPAVVSRQYFGGSFRAIARLAPGITREQAHAAAAGLVAGSRAVEPVSARVVSVEDEHLGAARRPLFLLFGGAGLLLLIACANVAGILLGEARARRHEIAVRTALGSGRARLVRQVFVEHALLAALGTVLGLAAAYWLIGVVITTAPEGLPRIGDVRLDTRAAVFATVCGLTTLMLFGVVPAVSVARTPVASTLAEGSREGGVSRVIGQRLAVVAQLALALVLLTGATLFAETMRRLTSQPLGFDARGVAVIATTFTGAKFGDPERMRRARQAGAGDISQFMDALGRETSNARDERVFERISALPGVVAVAMAAAAPFVAPQGRQSIVLEGQPDAERHEVWSQTVSEDYFDAMRIRRLGGRLFDPSDRPADSAAAVVSREFERRFFPEGAVNRRFRQVYGANFDLSRAFHIVGVVDDAKRQEFSDDDRPSFYMFDRQTWGGPETHFVVRVSGDVAGLLPAVRSAINEVTPQLVVRSMTVLEDRVARSVAEERFRAMLSAAFGVTALLLAAVGLYGVISRRTADRRREFGVRVALGARPTDVRGLVLRDALLLIAGGLALGLPAAYVAAQLTRSLLFGVSASSPAVFGVTVTTLALVAVAASLLPARQASRADPVAALRC
jgi:putative ABC transport system permease protein